MVVLSVVSCVEVSVFEGSDSVELGSSLEPSLSSGFVSGPGQFPADMPRTCMHGSWNLGRDGRLGKSYITPGVAGKSQIMIPPPSPPQPGQPTITGTTVELLSFPVVVIQVFVVHSGRVVVSMFKPGGVVLMVEVGGGRVVDDGGVADDDESVAVITCEDPEVSESRLLLVEITPPGPVWLEVELSRLVMLELLELVVVELIGVDVVIDVWFKKGPTRARNLGASLCIEARTPGLKPRAQRVKDDIRMLDLMIMTLKDRLNKDRDDINEGILPAAFRYFCVSDDADDYAYMSLLTHRLH